MKLLNFTKLISCLCVFSTSSTSALSSPSTPISTSLVQIQLGDNPFADESENIARRAAKEEVRGAMKDMMKTGKNAK